MVLYDTIGTLLLLENNKDVYTLLQWNNNRKWNMIYELFPVNILTWVICEVWILVIVY